MLLKEKAAKLSEQRETIGDNTLWFLDESVEKINKILEKEDPEQKKLKLSQVRKLRWEINSLIEEWKKLFQEAKTKEEKEDVVETILASMDYLFAWVNANRVFVRPTTIDIKDFKDLSTNIKLLSFMLPRNYDIKDLPSLYWWDCHLFWVSFYYTLLREIIWYDENITYWFNIDKKDNHWMFSINDKFIIDSDINVFFKKNNIIPFKTNFYKLKANEKIKELLRNRWENKDFRSFDEYISERNSFSKAKRLNLRVAWDKPIEIALWIKWCLLITIYFEKDGWKMLISRFNKQSTYSKTMEYNNIIDLLVTKLSKKDKRKEHYEKLFRTFNKEVLERILSPISTEDKIKTLSISWFAFKILNNSNIRTFAIKVFNLISIKKCKELLSNLV